ncbi:MAG: phosphoribosylaminoimidazolesuccinocarboxamide synthase [bacterium]
MKQNPILGTDFQIPGLKKIHTGKVRDVYTYESKGETYVFMVVTDRISAFDQILPVGIPYKGQVLNQISSKFLDMAEEHEISTWKINDIHPMVTVGVKAQPIMVEMIVRSYLTGSLYRDIYSKGGREICGITLPDDMLEFQQFEEFLVTPTTKAVSGHDQNISPKEIIQQGLATQEQYDEMESIALNLFEIGTEDAEYSGLILVDTKYEFGLYKGQVMLIDEIHTPDSSRYWYEESYFPNFMAGEAPRALDKEFVRQWLIQQGFKSDEGQIMPEIPEEFIQEVSDRYIELYNNIMGEDIQKIEYSLEDIETAIKDFIDGLEQMENPVEEIEE